MYVRKAENMQQLLVCVKNGNGMSYNGMSYNCTTKIHSFYNVRVAN